MNATSKPPRMWSAIIIRCGVVLLLVIAISIALRPTIVTWIEGVTKPDSSGDPVEIRLVGVAPDGDNILFDRRGRLIPGMQLNWPGIRTLSWATNQMQRDLLFELGPEAEELQFMQGAVPLIREANDGGWVGGVSTGFERAKTLSGHSQILVRLTLNDTYWRRGFTFGTSQRPLEEIEFDLTFYERKRGMARLDFDGPFVVGKTNFPREKLLTYVTVLTNKSPNLSSDVPCFRAWSPGPGLHEQQVFVYDANGKRYVPENGSAMGTPLGWTNEFSVPGLKLSNVAAITFGEQPLTKTFHNIRIKYPDRPSVAHSPILDRLAAALGQTNAVAVEHYSPRNAREAMTILEFRPDNRQAMSYLTGVPTDFNMLSTVQLEKLRQITRTWAYHEDLHHRQLGLRMGLRAGWLEYTSLALERLTNGPPAERIGSAYSLSAHTNGLGQQHLPILVELVRTNPSLALAPYLVPVMLRIGGPAANNAVRELAQAEDLVTWWSAMSRLNLNSFMPIEGQSEEMQQRLWMVHARTDSGFSPEIVAAGKTRLAGMLSLKLRASSFNVFESVLAAVTRKLDRRTATESIMNYLRSGTPEGWRENHPAEVVRHINDWYGKDFGGVGGVQKSGRSYPSSEAWPGVVEDVLEFLEKILRDEKSKP